MRSGRDLIGRPVMETRYGRRLGAIRDCLADPTTHRLGGFLVDVIGRAAAPGILPFAQVLALGPYAVMIAGAVAFTREEADPALAALAHQPPMLGRTPLITADGYLLGMVTDVYFDEDTGCVEGYATSGGLFGDPGAGIAFVPALAPFAREGRTVVVPPAVATLMEERYARPAPRPPRTTAAQRRFLLGKPTGRGLSALDGRAVAAPGQRMSAGILDAVEAGGLLAALDARAIQPAWPRRDATSPWSVKTTQGHRVLRTVRTEDGLVVAAVGQIVSERVLERAAHYRREQALVDAVADRDPARPPLTLARRSAWRLGTQLHATWKRVIATMQTTQGHAPDDIQED